MDFRAHETEISGDVRAETLNGRDMLVTPVVLVREQVLNGDFLSAQAIESSTPGWNGATVTVNHPQNDQDEYVSANTPESVQEYAIGTIFAAEYHEPDDDAPILRGEAWNDVERMVAMGGEALDVAENLAKHALDASDDVDTNDDEDARVMDVSTGYFHGRLDTSGRHNGERYRSEHVDLLPDHLAFLPNEKGACSVEDGCGAPRMNELTS